MTTEKTKGDPLRVSRLLFRIVGLLSSYENAARQQAGLLIVLSNDRILDACSFNSNIEERSEVDPL